MVFNPKRIIAAGGATLAAGVAAIAFTGGSAAAADTTVSSTPAANAATSGNWAGYVASGRTFSAVSGSWVQPTASCSSGGAGYAAFWVGLGGASNNSPALEQVGTQADCSGSGQPSYYAWYELVPAAPVKLGLTVHPGDHISANVKVNGSAVTMALTDTTTGQSATKTLQASQIDTSSAEWIAEAPSECSTSGDCQPLPLADFGKVTFTNATATAGSHTGSISDSGWQAQPVALSGGTSGLRQFGPAGVSYDTSGSSASAQASTLSDSGSAFMVAWSAGDGTSTSTGSGASSGAGSGGYGSGGYSGDPYGGGYPGGYGDGSGYGYGDGGGGGYPGGYGYGGGYPGGYGDGGGYVYSY